MLCKQSAQGRMVYYQDNKPSWHHASKNKSIAGQSKGRRQDPALRQEQAPALQILVTWASPSHQSRQRPPCSACSRHHECSQAPP
eukprot:7246589-Prorocentrum_lima.AAC.1